MKTLELKIFDVLTDRITVSEFENWLYNSNELLSAIQTKTLYFDIITINYKSTNWKQVLINLVKNNYGEKVCEIIKIFKVCSLISQSKTEDQTYEALCEMTENFNYDTDYSISLELYSLKDYFDLVREGFWKIGTLEIEAKFYAKKTLELFQEKEDFKDLEKKLTKDLESFQKEKEASLLGKILTLFKK